MAWFTRFTRFGDMHYVYGQERNMSCGLASSTMLVFKVNKLTPGVKALRDEDQIIETYQNVTGHAYDIRYGTFPEDLVRVLNKLTNKKWRNDYVTGPAVTQTIIDAVGVTVAPGPTVNTTPIIVGVNWQGGGAHWLVVDTVRKFGGKLYATVCDPWDGDVHVTPVAVGTGFSYVAKPDKTSWSLRGIGDKLLGKSYEQQLDRMMGKRAFAYEEAPSYGASSQWGVISMV